MLAVAHRERTLEEALTAALHGALRAARGEPAARCIVCGQPARRERALGGGWVTSCEACGSVLEEEGRPQLRLL